MKIAVITGASSGMGREFAIQLSHEANFDEMWVIARRKEALESLKDQVCCPIRPIAMDLLNPDSFQRYADLLDMVQPEIKVLVNCAGFGKFGRYDQIPLQDCMNMIDLNCKALVAMTAGTLQPNPRSMGRNAFPDSPTFPIISFITYATRAI